MEGLKARTTTKKTMAWTFSLMNQKQHRSMAGVRCASTYKCHTSLRRLNPPDMHCRYLCRERRTLRDSTDASDASLCKLHIMLIAGR